jgi:cytoskeletal protein RodZ
VANNTVRTIVIFGIITLVLGGAAVGVVRLMKARNNSYATSQAQPTATNNQPQQQQNPPAEQKKEETKQEEQKPQENKPAATETPAPAPSTPTPAPVTQQPAGGSPTSVAATGATPNGSMPATGPTEDLLATAGLLSLAAFFGAKLIRARADYRRYVGS